MYNHLLQKGILLDCILHKIFVFKIFILSVIKYIQKYLQKDDVDNNINLKFVNPFNCGKMAVVIIFVEIFYL
jgi:hypothetical protein